MVGNAWQGVGVTLCVMTEERQEKVERPEEINLLASTSSLLSTLVDCADDLFTPETEVRPFDVEW